MGVRGDIEIGLYSIVSTEVKGEDGLEDGGGGASVDAELSTIGTSPSLSC